MTTLTTRRLRLRPLRYRDAPAVMAYRNDPAVFRYQAWPVPFTVDAAFSLVNPQDLGSHGWVNRGIEAEGQLVGDIGLHTSRSGGEVPHGEVSISLVPAARGKGYAHEAMSALIDHAFAVVALAQVAADTHPANQAVSRMLERLGFLQVTTTSGRYRHREWVLYSDVWATQS